MRRTTSIILGAGGLLGSEVAAASAKAGLECPATAGVFEWEEPGNVTAKVRSLVAPLGPDDTLVVFWCAGRGFVGSTDAELDGATKALRATLIGLEGVPCRTHLTYASSGGAVWSGTTAMPITESTEASPAHAYGDAKLREEELVRAWSAGQDGRTATIARISNLFGRNQDVTKSQGLLSKLVANCIRGEPTTLFVPLDTGRDFLPATVAAQMLVEAGLRVVTGPKQQNATDVRIIAAGRSYTIAQVCGILQRMRRRRVPLVHVVADSTTVQPNQLSFLSNRDDLGVQVPALEESLRMMFDDESRRIALSL